MRSSGEKVAKQRLFGKIPEAGNRGVGFTQVKINLKHTYKAIASWEIYLARYLFI